MLTYMIVVNDNGEMKSITQDEFEAAYVAAGRQPHIEFFIDQVLDRRSADNELDIHTFPGGGTLAVPRSTKAEMAEEDGWDRATGAKL